MGQRRKALQTGRAAAKVGMGGSMAVLVYTGFRHGRQAMRVHTWAGMALLGFTLLHIYLYQPRRVSAAKRHAQVRQRNASPLPGAQTEAAVVAENAVASSTTPSS